MKSPKLMSKSRTMSVKLLMMAAVSCAAFLLPATSNAQTTSSFTPVNAEAASATTAAPKSLGVAFNEANSLKKGTDVVVLHRNYYAGETEYRYTRGTFQSWGKPLAESHEVQARVQHIQDKHEVQHPMSMYRTTDMTQLEHSRGHFADMELTPMNSSTHRSINMDHVVAIVRADELPAQMMSNASGTVPPSTYRLPSNTTPGTASGMGSTLGGASGTPSSRGTSSAGSTGSVGRGSSSAPSSSGRSSSAASSGRSSSGGSGCPVAPGNTSGRSSGSYGRSVSSPTATSVRSSPSSRGSSSTGSVTSGTGKKGGSSSGPR